MLGGAIEVRSQIVDGNESGVVEGRLRWGRLDSKESKWIEELLAYTGYRLKGADVVQEWLIIS
jgi:hypothetical protein